MKVSFYGAAKRVTGSNFLLQTNNKKILIDCGLFQGSKATKALNFQQFAYNPGDIDYMLLTHAHIDHSGRIPLLFNKGYKGNVICTKATRDLCSIMLPDSGHIQESSVEYKNRKRKRAGLELLEPLYTLEDATNCLKFFKGVQYNNIIELDENIKVRFRDAGHILGSASIEIWVTEDNKTSKIIFSGDIGKNNTPIIKDPVQFEKADYLVMESTYGNKHHKYKTNGNEKMFNIIEQTLANNGTVIIPSFSVGRTQEMIYAFNKVESIKEKWNKIKNVSVYVDSPLAISATEVFKNNTESFDEEAKSYILDGDNPLDFDNLIFTKSADESKAINFNKNPKIIISASGMCDAGRIKHHLKHNLWKKNTTVLFVGYQANGTLGRRLVDGEKNVRIFGESINVEARIEMIDGFSGHGDIDDLDKYIGSFKEKPKKIFLVHGEEEQLIGFSKRINEKFNIETIIPQTREQFELKIDKVSNESIKSDRKINKFEHNRLVLLNLINRLNEEVSDITQLISFDVINKLDERQLNAITKKYEAMDNKLEEVIKQIEGTINE